MINNKSIMEENNQSNPVENAPVAETPEQLTVSDAITGVFTSPGETFETIVRTPKKTYWVIPVIISVVVGIVLTFLFFRDEQLISGVMDKQKAALEKRMEEQVKSGKISGEQAKVSIEQAEKFMDPKGAFFQIIGYGGALVSPFLILFVLSLVYLVALKIMKAEFEFTNILNVVGLSMLVTIVGAVIGFVLSVITGEMSTVSLGLVLKDSSVGLKVHELISKIDVFAIWFYFLIGIGLSKIGKITSGKAYGVVFGIWILWIIVTSTVSFLMG
ncbi:MAG: YIP1 family protein [Bacteroidetes bacterium]|nr:YIP1 family protein [Bacteroidota bacterium]